MRPPRWVAVCAFLFLFAAPSAHAEFGLSEFDVTFENQDGSTAHQAGSHPFQMTTHLRFNSSPTGKGGERADQPVKDAIVAQIPGFVGMPTAVPRCSGAEFLTGIGVGPKGGEVLSPSCADETAVGYASVRVANPTGSNVFYGALYSLDPPPGVASRLGFWISGIPVGSIDVSVSEEFPYNVVATSTNISQILDVTAVDITVWGTPGLAVHDSLRGHCLDTNQGTSFGDCQSATSPQAFITLPRSCRGPLSTDYAIDSWINPGGKLANGTPDLSDPAWVTGSALTHDTLGSPLGMLGCGALGFTAGIEAEPTAKAATSPTGLDFHLNLADEVDGTHLGLIEPDGLANSDLEKAVVTLPEGFTTNPSIAAGLEVCTEADLVRERARSAPGTGCPDASKIGTAEVETPLLEQTVQGSLYVAEPYENPFGTLLALYLVLKSPELGIKVVQPIKVESDLQTGRLVSTTEDMPELPFTHFRLHFREGTRSPLVTPPGCGTHQATAELTPTSGAAPVTTTSAFEIVTGPEEGPCPTGGLPPFKPGLQAGTLNNAAGSFSPFNVRLTRSDSEQEFTNFSIKLPPGIAGKLAGIPYCSDAAIAAATARTGPHGGREELDAPSCPAASQVGRTLAGAGVGPSLAYAPGKIYLAGPYKGAPLSFVSITAGVVGPFDIGTVVVRLAIKVNPETGEVFLDSTGSDPIPHIVKGIPVHLRDVRAYTDRPEFTFNPTSCAETSTSATALGSGLDFVSAADDNPFVSTSRFQAADCAALPFKPKLSFKLKGSTKRAGNPSLRAHVAMNGFGEAAIRYAQVTLPKSEFLDQGHIGTICTRVQFKEGNVPGEKCPAASIYGKVIARTPILDAPLAGPIFLRSSEHKLPDLVAALNGQISVNLVGRVDSGKNGGIRNTFEFVPDAPVTSADFTFFGGKKGLLDNSRNLCAGVNKVEVLLKAHSGKRSSYKTPLQPTGCKKGKKSKR